MIKSDKEQANDKEETPESVISRKLREERVSGWKCVANSDRGG